MRNGILLVVTIVLTLTFRSFSLAESIKATTADGKGVTLKDDGTWQYAEKEDLNTPIEYLGVEVKYCPQAFQGTLEEMEKGEHIAIHPKMKNIRNKEIRGFIYDVLFVDSFDEMILKWENRKDNVVMEKDSFYPEDRNYIIKRYEHKNDFKALYPFAISEAVRAKFVIKKVIFEDSTFWEKK